MRNILLTLRYLIQTTKHNMRARYRVGFKGSVGVGLSVIKSEVWAFFEFEQIVDQSVLRSLPVQTDPPAPTKLANAVEPSLTKFWIWMGFVRFAGGLT